MAPPLHKNPCPRGPKIYNLGKRILDHHNYTLGLSVLCLGVEKKIFKNFINFTLFYSQITSPWGEVYERARTMNGKLGPVDLSKNEND